ncbi:MAG: hypothetical protein HY304_04395 [candidate division Zixibacteria bacterium]|nr:hypothetical protein [candidate division Zixibacteria bacterium]
MRMTLRVIGIVPMTFAMLATATMVRPSQAETLVLPVKTRTVTSDDAKRSRLVVDFGDLGGIMGKQILYAKCCLNVQWDTCGGPENEAIVMPLSPNSDPAKMSYQSVSDSPPEGLADSLGFTVNAGQRKDGKLEILLNEVVQEWANGKITNRGLILIPRMSGCQYDLTASVDFPGTGWGELVVEYEAAASR